MCYDVIMAPPVQTREQRFLTYTDWAGYLRCRKALDESGVRISYDSGRMELMTPSPEHQQGKSDLGRVLEAYLQEANIDFATGGSPTLRRETAEKGLEPDESYYLGENASGRLGPAPPGLNLNPPDLAIEVEVTRSALDRLAIFRSLGVREVWRYDYASHQLIVHVLRSEGYVASAASELLPNLPVQHLSWFVRRGQQVITSQLLREVRDWVRRQCPPLE